MSILTIQKTVFLSICPSTSTHINMLMIAIRMRQYDCSSNMQDIIDKINDWALGNKMELNSKKTKDRSNCFKEDISEPPLLANGDDVIERVKSFYSFKLLGLWCSNILKYNKHVEEITKKTKRLFHLWEWHRANLPTEFGLTCCLTKIRNVLPKYLTDEVEKIQTCNLRILALPPDLLQSLEQHCENLAISK